MGRVCSLVKCGAKLDVIPRGAAPACTASLPPQPGFPPSAQGPPPSSGSSSCVQVGAGAAAGQPEQLPKLRNKALPPRQSESDTRVRKSNARAGLCPALAAAARAEPGTCCPSLGPAPPARPQRDALAGGKAASGDFA